MSFFAFVGALSMSVFAFELASALSGGLFQPDRLRGVTSGSGVAQPRLSAWHALLVAIWPRRFDPRAAINLADVTNLLRRAGYPYDTPGEFYAAAAGTFSAYLAVGSLLAGIMYSL